MGEQRKMTKKSCSFKPLYDLLANFLREEKVNEEDIPLCQPTENSCPCSGLLKTVLVLYEKQPSENSKKLLSLLTDIFEETYLFNDSFHPKLLARNSYLCPELDITMYQPCGIDSCTFHTPHKDWCNNCILDYITKQSEEEDENKQSQKKKTSLSYNELTILTGIPTIDLKKTLNGALLKLRQAALKKQIEENNFEDRQYRLFSSSVCPVCERPISSQLVKKSIAYCSDICYNFKPPHVIKIEQDFGLPIDKILRCCLENFSSFNVISTSLGLDRSTLERLCTTYNLGSPTF